MAQMQVNPALLEWAQHRSGRSDIDMQDKLHKWDRWLSQELPLTLRDIERIAHFTRVPVGYFFLPEPPEEQIPIPDFRAGRNHAARNSQDLVETIYLNQRRQSWYEDYLTAMDEAVHLEYVGKALNMAVAQAAEEITRALGYTADLRSRLSTSADARKYLAEAFESIGGLVVFNSMVGNNSKRMLSTEEFRGFTLHSRVAPLVFINANDTKNGQVFSLLHEFAHVWRGDEGVSAGGMPWEETSSTTEAWCDSVAAEIAVPTIHLQDAFDHRRDLRDEVRRLSQLYHCSTLVVLIRLREVELINRLTFDRVFGPERARLLSAVQNKQKPSGGGDFYNNQPFRIGRTLSRAIIRDTQLGNTPMTEALRLLSFSKAKMFDKYSKNVMDS